MTETEAIFTQKQEQNIKKETLYRFGDLSDEAKGIAITQVFDIERELPQDFSFEYENVTEDMKAILTESGLYVDGEIYWDYRYTVDIDFSNVRMTDEFIKRHLSEAEYTLFTELEECTNDTIEKHLFHKDYNRDGITFEIGKFFYLIEDCALQFLASYLDDEDILVKYKLPALLLKEGSSDDFDFDELEGLQDDFEILAERYLEMFSDTISEHLEALVEKCRNVVTNLEAYLGSENYYKEELEAEAYVEQIYRFNRTGHVITRKDLFIEESFSQQYEIYQEEK